MFRQLFTVQSNRPQRHQSRRLSLQHLEERNLFAVVIPGPLPVLPAPLPPAVPAEEAVQNNAKPANGMNDLDFIRNQSGFEATDFDNKLIKVTTREPDDSKYLPIRIDDPRIDNMDVEPTEVVELKFVQPRITYPSAQANPGSGQATPPLNNAPLNHGTLNDAGLDALFQDQSEDGPIGEYYGPEDSQDPKHTETARDWFFAYDPSFLSSGNEGGGLWNN